MSDETEVWKPIEGYPLYEVSSEGRVRSWVRAGRSGEPRVLRGGINSNGYVTVTLARDGVQRQSWPVHQLVAEAFLAGQRHPGDEVRHMAGPTDNRVQVLAWGTRAANARDRVRDGHHEQRAKTHCPQNHPYDETNTYVSKRGHRYCRACKSARDKAKRAAARADKPEPTECVHGHEYTEENTYVAPNGRKRCRACRRDVDARWRAKKRAPRAGR